MMVLVTGGAGSGKSEYAESFIGSLPDSGRKYYIATMKCADTESLRRVERHRELRKDKGFITIEQPVDVEKTLECMILTQEDTPCETRTTEHKEPSPVLLECVSNLAANEMFAGGEIRSSEKVAEKVVSGIRKLKEKAGVLVAVTNNIFEDGVRYDAGTEEYIQALGMINRQLAKDAERVVEVVCGIPVVIKKEEA